MSKQGQNLNNIEKYNHRKTWQPQGRDLEDP